jgi:chorismate mutase
LTLDSIRNTLIRLEDSIIFGLLERAQYCYNADTYDSASFHVDGFGGSLVEFMVRETEKLHAKVEHSLQLEMQLIMIFQKKKGIC